MASVFKTYRSHIKIVIFVLVIVISWNILGIMIQGDSAVKWYFKKAPCQQSEETLTELKKLTFIMHDVLQNLGVAHAVCYGTLWGVLRSGKLLPWDNNIDMCVMYEEINKIDKELLQKRFKDIGVEMSFSSKMGHYELKYQTVNGYINVFDKEFFRFRSSSLKQIGWNNFLFSSNNELSIPSHLLEAPFPKIKFYDKEIPVPKGDFEILKSFYPDNWWMEVYQDYFHNTI
ncbi:hypothetical protein LOTGIDRAFT_155613 [Lottia gigantea]|uniref:LicD/FKTN/FKRP nucleotidyltransferase domain-containing protein n=1 Tax=Lottia gigantea TaxID=225164 RepID=V3Z160_LOTGI|nr:hypothetical protein LOTGIDRAFT_155613 [Lottia gigantea]ESO84278.1 hypothetical protein LOTGIDRAFT_155613 [Lottia gigantea]